MSVIIFAFEKVRLWHYALKIKCPLR